MQLSRQNARELPSFIKRPHFDRDQGLFIADRLRMPIYRDGEPVSSFIEGWQAEALSLLFYPIVTLQFRHANGAFAFWLLDASFTYIGETTSSLSVKALAGFGRRVASIAAFLGGCNQDALPYRLPDDVASFLRLGSETCQQILNSFGHTGLKDAQDCQILLLKADQGRFVSIVETDADGRHCFVGPDRRWELLAAGQPVKLQPGWRIMRLSSLFFPLFVADLHHEGGQVAYWFFDHHGNFMTDNWGSLPEPFRVILAAYSATIFEDLWQDVVAHPGDRTRDHVEAFLGLPFVTRRIVFDFHHSPPDPAAMTATWAITDPETETMSHVVQTEQGPMLLNRSCLEKGLLRYIQDQNILLANEGSISWPSPIHGNELPTSGFALLLDDQCFAYRVQDIELGFTFYIVALEWHFRTFALYFPENNLLITRNTEALAASLSYMVDYRLNFLRHAAEFGSAILAGLKKPPGPVYHTFRGYSAMHIGHFVWQDLSGIHHFLKAVRPDRIPQFLVPESYLMPEIYGPIDRIFPSLKGKVVRTNDMFSEMTSRLYMEHARVIKVTTTYVPRAVGSAILSAYKALPACRKLMTERRKIRKASSLIVLIGLRIGNRTIVDIRPFATRLVGAICQAFPDATIVIDGQNASPDASYASIGDSQTSPDSFLLQELDIARGLVDYAAANGYRLINNIGRPMVESLLWCDAADFFVAPWGAALAKYRWICNKPGLVLTGRWNLQNLHELSIYHHHKTNEDPTGMWFNDPQTVEDVVDADETNIDILKRSSFKIDTGAVEQQLLALLATTSGQSTNRVQPN